MKLLCISSSIIKREREYTLMLELSDNFGSSELRTDVFLAHIKQSLSSNHQSVHELTKEN